MKKSLSLLLAIALVISMFGSMAYAADDMTAQQKFDALKAKGIFAGYEDGTAGLDKDMTRAQFARVAALLLELDVDTAPAKSNFTDVSLTHWAVEEVNAVDAAGVMNGKGNGIFDPSGNVTIEQLARVLVDALGLEVDEDAVVEGTSAWAGGYVAAAIKAGLISADADFKADAKRELLVTAAFTANVAIEAAKAAAAIPATLEVKEVKANNLKTIYVEFNQAVNKDTVNTNTIKVEGKDVSEVALSEDGKIASVVLDPNVAQSTEIEVKVNGVKTADGKEVKDFSKKVIAADTTLPVLQSAKFVNHEQIELQFNEPMDFESTFFQGYSNIKLDGVNQIVKADPNYVANTVTLTFPALLKNGTLKLEVSDIADFAGYKIIPASFDIVVAEDKDAPVLTGATVKNRNSIEVTFNEKLSAAGEFKVNGNGAGDLNVDGNKVIIGSLGLDLGAVVEVKLAYKGQKDVVGNEIKDELTYSFKTADDTTIPSVSLKVEDGNKLVLTFTKSMQVNQGRIAVLNKDKEELQGINVALGLFKANTNNTVIELAAGTFVALDDINPDSFILQIKDAKDATVRQNPLPEQNIDFKALDTKAPEVDAFYTVEAGKNGDTDKDTVTFYFNEAMNVDTAKNLSNYIEEGLARPVTYIAGTSFKGISGDGKKVTLVVPNASAGTYVFTVLGLKDAAGQMMAFTDDIQEHDTTLALVATTAEAKAKNKVEVTFDANVGSVDPSTFYVLNAKSGERIPFVSASINGAVVTFTTSKNLPANVLDADDNQYQLIVGNANGVQSVYGNKIALVAKAKAADIDDLIAPTVASSKKDPANADKYLITFDEIIDNLDDTEIIVRDKDGALVAFTADLIDDADANQKVLEITITKTPFDGKVVIELNEDALTDDVGNANKYIKVDTGSTKLQN